MTFDFSQLLKMYSKKFASVFNGKIKDMKGWDGQPFAPIEPSTQAAGLTSKKTKKKGKIGITGIAQKPRAANSRLNRTGILRETAFTATSDDTSITVIPTPGNYPASNVSYEDLLMYNSRGSGKTNTRIKQGNAPLVLPIDSSEGIQQLEDAMAIDPVFIQFKADLEKVMMLQMGEESPDKVFTYTVKL